MFSYYKEFCDTFLPNVICAPLIISLEYFPRNRVVETVLIKYQSQRYFSFLYLPDFSEVLHPQNSFSPQLSSFNSNIPFSFCSLFLAYLIYSSGFKCKLYVDNSLISISHTDLFSNLFPHIFGCFPGMSHPTSSHLIAFSPSQPVPPLPY